MAPKKEILHKITHDVIRDHAHTLKKRERLSGHAHTLRTRAKQDERVRRSVRYGSSFLLVDPFWQNHLWVGFLKLPRAQLQVINSSTPLWFKSLWRLSNLVSD
ncbi:hypothetical protein BDA99DRAFT_571387 [Phascolomyces articulosus]|uniref:Uncharacterized protein n=1 Tax=Phascolomyces articulosus TaxID=60185 RepID=A0AAD5PGJ4_9FUNG|nr:hypothetical protein BDA99DRAFT_571387 [Phascolomyces articulosus]